MKKIYLEFLNKYLHLSLLISLLLFNSCNSNSGINKLEINYLPQGTTTDIPLECEMFSKSFIENIKTKEITSSNFIEKFKKEIQKLKTENSETQLNTRIQILIFKNNKIDTVCMGEFFGTKYKGEFKKDNNALRNLIKKEIYTN